MTPTTTATAEPATEEDTAEAAGDNDEAAKPDGDTDAAGKTKTPVRVAAAASGADSKKLLADANRLLRAERFAEAREMFEKLTKSKRERGRGAGRARRDLVPGEEICGRGALRRAGGRARRRRQGARAAG